MPFLFFFKKKSQASNVLGAQTNCVVHNKKNALTNNINQYEVAQKIPR